MDRESAINQAPTAQGNTMTTTEVRPTRAQAGRFANRQPRHLLTRNPRDLSPQPPTRQASGSISTVFLKEDELPARPRRQPTLGNDEWLDAPLVDDQSTITTPPPIASILVPQDSEKWSSAVSCLPQPEDDATLASYDTHSRPSTTNYRGHAPRKTMNEKPKENIPWDKVAIGVVMISEDGDEDGGERDSNPPPSVPEAVQHRPATRDKEPSSRATGSMSTLTDLSGALPRLSKDRSDEIDPGMNLPPSQPIAPIQRSREPQPAAGRSFPSDPPTEQIARPPRHVALLNPPRDRNELNHSSHSHSNQGEYRRPMREPAFNSEHGRHVPLSQDLPPTVHQGFTTAVQSFQGQAFNGPSSHPPRPSPPHSGNRSQQNYSTPSGDYGQQNHSTPPGSNYSTPQHSVDRREGDLYNEARTTYPSHSSNSSRSSYILPPSLKPSHHVDGSYNYGPSHHSYAASARTNQSSPPVSTPHYDSPNMPRHYADIEGPASHVFGDQYNGSSVPNARRPYDSFASGSTQPTGPANRLPSPPRRPSLPSGGIQIDVGQGKKMPLRGAKETWAAIGDGRITITNCLTCQIELNCLDDALMVICPDCTMISPVDQAGDGPESSSNYGVGVGVKPEEVIKWLQKTM